MQIFIDGNENIKVDSLPSNAKLTQYTNGHYYLFIPTSTNPAKPMENAVAWHTAVNQAITYKLAGQRGYLATIYRSG